MVLVKTCIMKNSNPSRLPNLAKPIENEALGANEIDSENAIVAWGCTLERWLGRGTHISVPTSEDLKSIKILVAAICYGSSFKNSPNPIAKCAQECRAADGGQPTFRTQ